MRVVQHLKRTELVAYRALWALGAVAGLFALVVGAFMIANNLRLKSSDPIHTPALQRLAKELKSSPENEVLKEQIRELDYLARRAFFTSQHFNRVAICLLLGSLAVTIVALRTLNTYDRKVPYPDPHDSKDDLVANALWARQSVTVVGMILVGLALTLALPWKSTLDHPPREAAVPSVSAAKILATIASETSAPTTTKIASREERMKHWPSFRGPASGHGAASNLPTHWDGKSGQGILWKTAIALPGFGSPIVWSNRVFVSGGNKQTRAVYAIDATNGKLLWEKAVPTKLTSPSETPEVNADTGYAAPTMATDGDRVFAIFATGDLAAFDFTGTQVWTQHLGVPVNPYGHSSSLETFEDTLIVQFDHKKSSFVAAFDVRTGATRWRTERKLSPSWASPALVAIDGHTELILVADAFVTSYDPTTGRELWQIKCLASADVAQTPVFANGLLYLAADQVKFVAINMRTRKIVWENTDETPGIGTLVAYGDALFAGLSDGGIACWDAQTGKRRWLQETEDGFYASPIVAGSRVFLTDRTGKTYIFEASGADFSSVAQSILGEESVSTPAIYGESLIYRGAKHLFRIGL